MFIGLLEDDLAIREMIQLVLENEGYTVVIYLTSEECLADVQTSSSQAVSCGLLIVDKRLSRSDSGMVVIEQIRSNPQLAQLPIILTTASAMLDKAELERLRVTLLPKPFDIDNISRLVTELTRDVTL